MKTLLLIEDNNEMRENTAEILELANYKVLTAKNGKLGVELALKEKPDLIICDIMMPALDGYGVLHSLSRNKETASIPFIFLTAKSEKNDFRKGMNMGADDYVTKPFDDVELLNAIESRLKKNEILKSEFSKSADGLSEFMENVRKFPDLEKLSQERKLRVYKKKEMVFSEGNYPLGLYFINKGKIKTFRSNEHGKELITGLHKDGDFIGYLALLEETSYSESAMALEDSEIYLIPRDDFFSLIYKNSDVSKKFIRILSDNLSEKEEQLVKLAYNSVRKRVAEALVTLQNRYHKDTEKNFSINISREDLGGIAGTSTESAIRTLSDFKEEKLVEINGGNITILDYEKLAKMKN